MDNRRILLTIFISKISEIPRDIIITLLYLLFISLSHLLLLVLLYLHLLAVVLVTVGEFLKLLGVAFGRPSGQRWQYFRDGFFPTLSTIFSKLGRLVMGDAASPVVDETVDV